MGQSVSRLFVLCSQTGTSFTAENRRTSPSSSSSTNTNTNTPHSFIPCGSHRTLLIFSITIVKCQWFLYFDDYHEQGPIRSSIHSAVWTYLHFMLNLSQLLLGVGCLDLMRVYQSTRGGSSVSITESSHYEAPFPNEAAGAGGLTADHSLEVGTGGLDKEGPGHEAAIYVKKYYLIVAASVFFWNAAIKFVTSRPKGRGNPSLPSSSSPLSSSPLLTQYNCFHSIA